MTIGLVECGVLLLDMRERARSVPTVERTISRTSRTSVCVSESCPGERRSSSLSSLRRGDALVETVGHESSTSCAGIGKSSRRDKDWITVGHSTTQVMIVQRNS